MINKEGINDRILKEVDKLSVPEINKELLRSLLAYEIEVSDQARPRFKEKYKSIFSTALTGHKK